MRGADAALVGEVVTATRAADFAPLGRATFAVVMSTVVKPGGVKWFPGRSVVVPVQRSKNLSTYATSDRCTAENLISTVTRQDEPNRQFVSADGSAHFPLVQKATPVIGGAVAGA